MEQYLALRASAGSGKTFALALRYVYLLCKGAKPYEILTLTFTNKASHEMRHRISQSLKNLLQDTQNGTLTDNVFFKELQKNGITQDFIQQHIARIYDEFNQAHTRITTLDSFFYTILQKFCWYVGVASDFKIGRYTQKDIYERFLQSFSPNELRDFVRFCDQYFGTNQKILNFLDILWHYDELEEVFSHFTTNTPLKQITQAIESKVAFLQAKITNIEGISQSGINAFADTKIETLATKKWVIDGSQYHYFKKLKIQSLDSEFEALRELLRQYFSCKENEIFSRVFLYIERFRAIKNAYLSQTNILNYHDITYKVLELLYTHHDRAFFYFRLDDKIMHILLDEFQDTSVVQYQILLPLIEEILSGSGRIQDRSVFMVGDTKQSIYGFRGGFSEVFDTMAQRLKVDELAYNYRSSNNVLEFINTIFGAQYGASYIPQKLKNQDSQGYVSVRFTNTQDSQAMSDEVCEIIYQSVCELLEHGAKFDEITIVTFTNQEVEMLRDFLKFRDPSLQIIVETSQNFFDTFPCNVILNALYYAHTQNILYKYNIAKLLGKELFWNPPLPASVTNCAQYVYEVIESLHLGCVASMRFLEQACEYESIQDFLQAYELLEVNAPKESSYGIRIMTIHKSKGLEFKHLIVSDSLKTKLGTSHSKIVYEYKGINLVSAYYVYGGRENIDSAYKTAKDAKNALDEIESLNQLYVAFTRAKQSLVVAAKSAKSRFERLNLRPCTQGSLESNEITPHTPKQTQVLKNPYTPLPKLGRQGDFMRIESDNEPQEFSLESILFGKALHSYFEYLLGKQCTPQDTEQMQHITRNLYGFVLPQHTLQAVQDTFLRAIHNQEFMQLYTSRKVHTEVSYLHNGRFFRVDAILQDDNELIVLDYKSSHLPKDEHFMQVKEYVDFLGMLSGKPTKGYLIYPAKTQMCVAIQGGLDM